MTNFIIFFILHVLPMDGMYILLNDLNKGTFHYFEFYFIDIDLEANNSKFISIDGEILMESRLSLEANNIICNDAQLILSNHDSDQIKLTFMDATINDEIYYLKLHKVERGEKLPSEIKEINDYLFYTHISFFNVRYLYPITKLSLEGFEYLDLSSRKPKQYRFE